MVRGVEDGFARNNIEPATISPRLLRNGWYADLASGQNTAIQLRNYDDGGRDRSLVDHFDLPGEVVSGSLIIRVADAGPGSSNDGVLIGDLDTLATPDRLNSMRTFTITMADAETAAMALPDGSRYLTIPFERLKLSGAGDRPASSLLDYLGRKDHPRDVDIVVSDDTKVDAMALLVCSRSAVARGVTFVEHRLKPIGAEVSWMGCAIDQSQNSCDPLAGDRVCSAAGQIACYHDGGRTAPPGLRDIGVANTAFVGGEIRLSRPVQGDAFAHLTDANRFCAANFGAGWRVLSYHEGGGAQVVSYSAIAPRTRALVNIRDQQYANCWDWDVKR